MTKTIQLTGRALELAQAIDTTMTDTNKQIGKLKEQADALHKAAESQAEKLHEELKHELGLDKDACCHLDMTYVSEHGLAFVKTGCERSGGIGGLLGSLLGGITKPDTPSGSGGLH